ncbi:unnamed protein product [Brachionus calyciflorus]|uniref:Androgen-dependent TFPI-regulating protein n=1 Tax=Brachionus calyciflorus TaxID=104777 RepID=A0A814HEB5_9BILA|nr:unnamed protein product [Brachionus calyciflorus]
MNFFQVLIYFGLFILYFIGLWRKTEDVKTFGGRYKYLTSLDMILQLVFFSICFIDSLRELIFKKSFLKDLRSFIFRSLAFPIGTFVFFSFWLIYFIDRELVFPKIYDAIIPSWHNHIMHTLPLIGVIIECYLNKYEYQKSSKVGCIPTFLVSIGYLIWVLIVRKYGGIWVYPFMAVLSTLQRFLVLSIFSAIVTGFYEIGKILNTYFWSKNSKKSKGS